ncbi:hypothetical protein SYNPS1DRAFT_22942 [Syncephalis pseudoplumigaleata]|uniref:Uncharacterized protein n=1 Tax=Syncephalis pseudoplumigaleata TaxID=1712513 RepID=A0A4P9YY68_9FUNG|nr:hypothetical protein SYNPS1DRAFT_22942 [Syncephalis pseudoplumigaleata]|eukprot:RKP25027.1 hypothetical protein SYNPS1DRAFT_22942 [Syncephalis pseudoplumigaleata]
MLVKRILAVEGPMVSKQVYSKARAIYGDEVKSYTYFKRKILVVMKKHEQLKTRTNIREIQAVEQRLKEERAVALKDAKEAHEEMQKELQEKYGASFTKTAFRKSKKAVQTKAGLPPVEFRWHLLAKPQQINAWKAAGLPTAEEIDALAVKYNEWVPPTERPEAIRPPWQR